MNRSSITDQQLLPKIEAFRTRMEAAQQRLREANERLQAEISDRRRAEQARDGLEERLKTLKVDPVGANEKRTTAEESLKERLKFETILAVK